MVYNPEAEIMQVVNLAHRFYGLFKSNKQIEDGIYLDFHFENPSWKNRFARYLINRNIGKKVLVLTANQCSVLI
jgi:hypothetical protein